MKKTDQALYYVKIMGKDAYHLFESMPEDLKNNRQTGCQMDLDQLMRQVTEKEISSGCLCSRIRPFFIYLPVYCSKCGEKRTACTGCFIVHGIAER